MSIISERQLQAQMATERAAKRQRLTEPRPTRKITLDPRGDVVLSVQERLHIRVSSRLLSHYSRPFAAIFNGPWLESQHLDSQDPPVIDFAEDDADLMLLLCRLMHNDVINQDQIWPLDQMGLVMLADKYDCCSIVKPIIVKNGLVYLAGANFEIDITDESIELQEMVQLIIMAYAMNAAKLFCKATVAFIYRSKPDESLAFASSVRGSHLVPADCALWTLLAEAKAKMRKHVWHMLRRRLRGGEDDREDVRYNELGTLLEEHEEEHGQVEGQDTEDLAFFDLDQVLDRWDVQQRTTESLLRCLKEDLEKYLERKAEANREVCKTEKGLQRLTNAELRDRLMGPGWAWRVYSWISWVFTEKKSGFCLECVKKRMASRVKEHVPTCDNVGHYIS